MRVRAAGRSRVAYGRAALLAAAAVSGAPPSAARAREEPLRPLGAHGPLATERLSDERALSRWAYPERLGRARRRPDAAAARVAPCGR